MADGATPDREVVLETDRLVLRPWRVAEAIVQRELWTERDPRVPRIRRQIEKDKALLVDPASGVAAYTWHIVASGRSDSLGADPAVLDLLDEAGIGCVIHLP